MLLLYAYNLLLCSFLVHTIISTAAAPSCLPSFSQLILLSNIFYTASFLCVQSSLLCFFLPVIFSFVASLSNIFPLPLIFSAVASLCLSSSQPLLLSAYQLFCCCFFLLNCSAAASLCLSSSLLLLFYVCHLLCCCFPLPLSPMLMLFSEYDLLCCNTLPIIYSVAASLWSFLLMLLSVYHPRHRCFSLL